MSETPNNTTPIGTEQITFEQQETLNEIQKSYPIPAEGADGCCVVSALVSIFVLCGIGLVLNLFLGMLFILSIVPAMVIIGGILNFMKPKVFSNLLLEMFSSGFISTIIALANKVGLNILIYTISLELRLAWFVQTSNGEFVYTTTVVWKVINSCIQAFFVGAAVEELVKLYLIYRIRNRLEMDSPQSCVIYTLTGASGFATLSNVEYITNISALGSLNGMITACVKAFLSVPVHLTCAALIGVIVAKKMFLNCTNTTFYVGVLSAILIHGIHDLVIFLVRDLTNVFWALIAAHSFGILLTLCVLLYTIHLYRRMCHEWDKIKKSTDGDANLVELQQNPDEENKQ